MNNIEYIKSKAKVKLLDNLSGNISFGRYIFTISTNYFDQFNSEEDVLNKFIQCYLNKEYYSLNILDKIIREEKLNSILSIDQNIFCTVSISS